MYQCKTHSYKLLLGISITLANEQEYQSNSLRYSSGHYSKKDCNNDQSHDCWENLFTKMNQNNKNIKGYNDFNNKYTNGDYNTKTNNKGNENAGYQGKGRGRSSGIFMGKKK